MLLSNIEIRKYLAHLGWVLVIRVNKNLQTGEGRVIKQSAFEYVELIKDKMQS